MEQYMSNFHIGQKVVCINTWPQDDVDNYGYGDEVGPVAGSVYTIRDIEWRDDGSEGTPCVCVRLYEITNPVRIYTSGGKGEPWEQNFGAYRFRPVKTTDISIFTAMLAPTPRIKETIGN